MVTRPGKKKMKTYSTEFVRNGRSSGDVVYEGPSKAKARKAAADALGYRDIRSAYEYTSTTREGDEGVFYCRRKESHREDFDAAIITQQEAQ